MSNGAASVTVKNGKFVVRYDGDATKEVYRAPPQPIAEVKSIDDVVLHQHPLADNARLGSVECENGFHASVFLCDGAYDVAPMLGGVVWMEQGWDEKGVGPLTAEQAYAIIQDINNLPRQEV